MHPVINDDDDDDDVDANDNMTMTWWVQVRVVGLQEGLFRGQLLYLISPEACGKTALTRVYLRRTAADETRRFCLLTHYPNWAE